MGRSHLAGWELLIVLLLLLCFYCISPAGARGCRATRDRYRLSLDHGDENEQSPPKPQKTRGGRRGAQQSLARERMREVRAPAMFPAPFVCAARKISTLRKFSGSCRYPGSLQRLTCYKASRDVALMLVTL